MKSKLTVLITGSSGFIGRVLAAKLMSDGWQVITTSRCESKLGQDTIFLNLSRPETISRLARTTKLDYIVHLGARIGWTGESDSDLFVPNVLATGLLAKLAFDCGAKLIFLSAAIIHGVRTENVIIDSPLVLDTPYGRSKWLAEQLIEVSGVSSCILRVAGVFGLSGPEHLGLNKTISNVTRGKVPQLIGSGLALRNYIFVKDVVTTIAYALDNGIEGTHLIAGTEVISIKTMLQKVVHVFCPNDQLAEIEGPEAKDQIVEPSKIFPETRGFCEALFDIQQEIHS